MEISVDILDLMISVDARSALMQEVSVFYGNRSLVQTGLNFVEEAL